MIARFSDNSDSTILKYKLFKRFSMISSLVSLSKTSSSFLPSSAAIEGACGASSSCSSEYSAVKVCLDLLSSGEVEESLSVLGLPFLLPDISCATCLNKRHRDGALKAFLLRHLVSPSLTQFCSMANKRTTFFLFPVCEDVGGYCRPSKMYCDPGYHDCPKYYCPPPSVCCCPD